MSEVMTYIKTGAEVLTEVYADASTRNIDVVDVRACKDEWDAFNAELIEKGDEETPPKPADSLGEDISQFDALEIESVPSSPVAKNYWRVGLFGVMARARSY